MICGGVQKNSSFYRALCAGSPRFGARARLVYITLQTTWEIEHSCTFPSTDSADVFGYNHIQRDGRCAQGRRQAAGPLPHLRPIRFADGAVQVGLAPKARKTIRKQSPRGGDRGGRNNDGQKERNRKTKADALCGRAGRSGDCLSLRHLSAVAGCESVRAGVSVFQSKADAAAGGGIGAVAALFTAAVDLRAAVSAWFCAALAVRRAQAARCRACGALRGVRSGAGADCVALLGRGSRSWRCRGSRTCFRALCRPSSPDGCSADGWRSPMSRCGR